MVCCTGPASGLVSQEKNGNRLTAALGVPE